MRRKLNALPLIVFTLFLFLSTFISDQEYRNQYTDGKNDVLFARYSKDVSWSGRDDIYNGYIDRNKIKTTANGKLIFEFDRDDSVLPRMTFQLHTEDTTNCTVASKMDISDWNGN